MFLRGHQQLSFATFSRSHNHLENSNSAVSKGSSEKQPTSQPIINAANSGDCNKAAFANTATLDYDSNSTDLPSVDMFNGFAVLPVGVLYPLPNNMRALPGESLCFSLTSIFMRMILPIMH